MKTISTGSAGRAQIEISWKKKSLLFGLSIWDQRKVRLLQWGHDEGDSLRPVLNCYYSDNRCHSKLLIAKQDDQNPIGDIYTQVSEITVSGKLPLIN